MLREVLPGLGQQNKGRSPISLPDEFDRPEKPVVGPLLIRSPPVQAKGRDERPDRSGREPSSD
jgi:hypothetical protein